MSATKTYNKNLSKTTIIYFSISFNITSNILINYSIIGNMSDSIIFIKCK